MDTSHILDQFRVDGGCADRDRVYGIQDGRESRMLVISFPCTFILSGRWRLDNAVGGLDDDLNDEEDCCTHPRLASRTDCIAHYRPHQLHPPPLFSSGTIYRLRIIHANSYFYHPAYRENITCEANDEATPLSISENNITIEHGTTVRQSTHNGIENRKSFNNKLRGKL